MKVFLRSIFVYTIFLSIGITSRLLLSKVFTPDYFQGVYEITTPINSFKRVSEALWLIKHGKSPYSGSIYNNIPLLLFLYDYLASKKLHLVFFISVDCVISICLALIAYLYYLNTENLSENKLIEKLDCSPQTESIIESNNINNSHLDPSMVVPSSNIDLKSLSNSQCIQNNNFGDKIDSTADTSDDLTVANNNNPKDCENFEITRDLYPTRKIFPYTPFLTALLHLVNPLSIFTCISYSTQCISNLVIVLSCTFSLLGSNIFGSFFLALAIYLDPYSITLVLPSALLINWRSQTHLSVKKTIFTLVKHIILIVIFFGILFVSSDYYLDFLNFKGEPWWRRYYGFVLVIPDVQFNTGIFWYFFTGIFSNYRSFFVFVFQYHIFIYPIIISIRLKDKPLVVWWIVLTINSALKSYPSSADVSLVLTFLPIIYHLQEYMNYGLVTGIAAIVCFIFYPKIRELWMKRLVNSNFYYSLNILSFLVYTNLITQTLNSIFKRNYILKQLKKKLN